MRDVVMIVDLQFGSTGKGQVAGALGRLWGADTAVCANGPNAGHTYRWLEQSPRSATETEDTRLGIVRTVMPVTSILPTVRNILLGPGAVIDLAKLKGELLDCHGMLGGKRLIIHPNAAVVLPHHVEAEKALVGIGSTMKGTAEANIEKMRRRDDAPVAKFVASLILDEIGAAAAHAHLDVVISYEEYDRAIDGSDKMLVEGAQGHSLSMHSRFYPHTTSRAVSIAQMWSDCHLPFTPAGQLHIVGVCRTYPIRVANRFNDEGQQIGYSGDCYPDQREMKWEEIEREPELTTVTKLPRRLFSFSTQQIMEAVRFNAPSTIALTFCDYLCKEIERPGGPGEGFNAAVASLIHRVEAAGGCPVNILSYGPLDTDMYSRAGISDPVLKKLTQPWDWV